MVHRVTTNTANASALSQNVTAGYLAVLGEALEQKYGGQEPRPNVMIRDERFMRSVGGVARACAGLRIDDFSTRLSQYVVSTPTGIAFNRGLLENVPSVSELEKTNIPKTLHTEAIGCPAKYVRGLIPLVIELVNIALEKADTTEI